MKNQETMNNETITTDQMAQIANLLTDLHAQSLEPTLHKMSTTEAVISHIGENEERITMLVWSRDGKLVATEISPIIATL